MHTRTHPKLLDRGLIDTVTQADEILIRLQAAGRALVEKVRWLLTAPEEQRPAGSTPRGFTSSREAPR